MKVQVYTDGACSGNPGIGGWGVYFDKLNVKINGSKRLTTNNEMELTAIYYAVSNYGLYGVGPGDELVICSDSSYCINTFTKWLKDWINKGILFEKKNHKLILKISEKIDFLEKILFIKVSFEKVLGHSGVKGNEMADRLARNSIEELTNTLRGDKQETLIVYIATGKYSKFLPGFISTLNNFNLGKTIIDVYTDCDINIPGVNVINIENQYWPIVVLNKFKYILNSINRHPNVKQVWYFDSKIEFTREFKPKSVEDLITLFPHNSWNNVLTKAGSIQKAWSTYHWNRELNKKSKAYICFDLVNQPYIQSAAFGGPINLMKEMCLKIEGWIKSDLMHCIIPMWHDETYLNKYAVLFPANISFEEPGTLGEKESEVTDNKNAVINFRNTDEIQQDKLTIYNS